MEDFTGKVCFVTGGANGIGRSIVESFVDCGAIVAFCDTDNESAEDMVRRMDNCFYYPADVSDPVELIRCMDQIYIEYGDIDIIINNAGISLFSPLVETALETFDKVINTNLRSVFITAREMAARRDSAEGRAKYGRIINISSTRYLQSEPGTEAYAASKGGIVSLTHALAVSFSEYNITVNCISPGWIDTGHYGELSVEDHRQHPSGRVGVPEDIARLCVYLASPANDFINGQNIIADGGMTRKMIYM